MFAEGRADAQITCKARHDPGLFHANKESPITESVQHKIELKYVTLIPPQSMVLGLNDARVLYCRVDTRVQR